MTDRQSIGAAIVAASEKDFVGFKNALEPDIEDRLRGSIQTRSSQVEATMFGKPEPVAAEPEVEVDDVDAGADE